MSEQITMKHMCEKIVEAGIVVKKDGSKPTPEDVFKISPSGELWPVFRLYYIALEKLKMGAGDE